MLCPLTDKFKHCLKKGQKRGVAPEGPVGGRLPHGHDCRNGVRDYGKPNRPSRAAGDQTGFERMVAVAYHHRMAAIAYATPLAQRREPGWIYRPSWDLPLIIFSAALVPFPFLVAWLAQASGWMKQQQAVDLINITVALLIGGPHLFSTITYTFLDGNFRNRYPWYVYLAFILPIGVMYLGVYHYTFLVTFFFSWAS